MTYDYDRRAFSHDVQVTTRGNVLLFRVGAAELSAQVGASDLEVIGVDSPENMRGQGVGKALYRALFQEAQKMGRGVISDVTVEEPAARVWESLKREGYPIVKHPNARPLEVDGAHGWYVHMQQGKPLSQPVFRLRR